MTQTKLAKSDYKRSNLSQQSFPLRADKKKLSSLQLYLQGDLTFLADLFPACNHPKSRRILFKGGKNIWSCSKRCFLWEAIENISVGISAFLLHLLQCVTKSYNNLCVFLSLFCLCLSGGFIAWQAASINTWHNNKFPRQLWLCKKFLSWAIFINYKCIFRMHSLFSGMFWVESRPSMYTLASLLALQAKSGKEEAKRGRCVNWERKAWASEGRQLHEQIVADMT